MKMNENMKEIIINALQEAINARERELDWVNSVNTDDDLKKDLEDTLESYRDILDQLQTEESSPQYAVTCTYSFDYDARTTLFLTSKAAQQALVEDFLNEYTIQVNEKECCVDAKIEYDKSYASITVVHASGEKDVIEWHLCEVD